MKHLFAGIALLLLLCTNIKANRNISDLSSIDDLALNTPQYAASSIESLVIFGQSNTQSELELVRFYFVWLAQNIVYDTIEFKATKRILAKQSYDSVFQHRKAICRGYADLLAILCQKSGIDARTISGYTKSIGQKPNLNEVHAWNAIKIQGQWHLFDVTWASNYLVCSGRVDYRFNDYFLQSPNKFTKRHFPFDPIWQLSNKIVTPDVFFSEKTEDVTVDYFTDFTKILDQEAVLLSYEQHIKSYERAITFLPQDKRLHNILNFHKSEKAIEVQQWSKQDFKEILSNAQEAKILFEGAFELYESMSLAVEDEDISLIQCNKKAIAQNNELTGKLIQYLQNLEFEMNKIHLAGINKRN
jgi:Transglutaminase-like superfamily